MALYLAQTDTTVGFVSKNKEKIIKAKQRDSQKPILMVVSSLQELQKNVRAPKHFRNRIRRSCGVSFIYHNQKCIRVAQDERHRDLLERFGWVYSSSANLSGESFDFSCAYGLAEVIVYEQNTPLQPHSPSKIFKINHKKIQRVR